MNQLFKPTSFFRTLLASMMLFVGLGAHAAKGSDPALDAEVLVKLRSTAALGPVLVNYRLGLLGQFGERPIYRLKILSAASVDATIAALRVDPDVLLADPNFIHQSPEARRAVVWAIGTPDAYTAQWAPQALRLAEAHAVSKGAGTRVAVLDSGVDLSHPALAGRLLPGFDFVDFDNTPSVVGTSGQAGFAHGTHVAGIVAMVAPSAAIMPIRVLDANGQGNAWVLAEAMLYAVDPDGDPNTDDGAHVINMSLGSLSRTHLMDAIAHLVSCAPPDPLDPVANQTDPGYDDDRVRCAASRGAVIVAAAGNDGSKGLRQYPAAEGAYGLLSVGASNSSGGLAAFSNFGSWVQVAAPGEGITSSVPNGGFGTWSGTSMAAPMASGLVALLRTKRPELVPTALVRKIERNTTALCDSKIGQISPLSVLLDVPTASTACR